MRKSVFAAAAVAVLAAVSWNAAPARAMAISAPAALKSASDSVKLTEAVHCWDCGYYGGPRFYRPYYTGYHRPYYRPYYRPYHRPYYSHYRPYYRPYHRPYYHRPYWGGGYGYSYAPRPRFYVGPRVYWY